VSLHTSKCVIQTGIYRTLTDIEENKEFNAGEVARLKKYLQEQKDGLSDEETFENAQNKADRMATMGVEDAFDPVLGEAYVELNEVYRVEMDTNKKINQPVIFRYVIAVTEDGGTYKLHKLALHELMGKTVDNFWFDHFPYTSWGTDPERTDFWSDGVGDILRTPNKIVNSWVAQLVENRTLRNYGMTYYDSSDATFVPQTFQPIPYGFYPVPGDPNKVMRPVEIPDLSESLDEIQFIIGLAEKATASTSAQGGAIEQRQVTLGEVQLALANAQDRVKAVQQFIDDDWQEFGLLFIKVLEGAGDLLEPVTVHKKGRLGKKMYTREISLKDWKTKSGYTCEVRMLEDKQAEDIDNMQKMKVAVADMPNNIPLKEIANHHTLQFAGLTPDEISRVEEFEAQGGSAPAEVPGEVTPGADTPNVPDLATMMGGMGGNQPVATPQVKA
jgi:hypothetical protein